MFGNNDMGPISPVKDLILFGAIDVVVGIIAESCLGISFGFLYLLVVFRLGFLRLLSLVAAKTGLESMIKVSSDIISCSINFLLIR